MTTSKFTFNSYHQRAGPASERSHVIKESEIMSQRKYTYVIGRFLFLIKFFVEASKTVSQMPNASEKTLSQKQKR